ncbi:MAG: DNA recombination protein RmuC [Terracidiphilus sp.]|jgi:DNA recombination protein RmuC
MQIVVVALTALIAGILVGLLVRGFLAKSNRAESEALSAERELQLAELREELGRSKAESAARAGFESLAAEREKRIGELSGEIDLLRASLNAKTDEAGRLASTVAEANATLESERKSLPERLRLLETAQRTFNDHFRAVAVDVLKGEKQTLSEANTTQINPLLTSLKDEIKGFREKVEQAQTESLVGRTQLSAELEQLKGLNERLSADAESLANALTRDTSEQGHWGELVLLDILEDCGLKRGLHYTYQQTFVADGENGLREERKRTDVILRFPEGRSLVVDSKVTLNAHKDYVDATDEAARKDALDRLVASVRSHMRELSAKSYQELLGERSPDYVVLFAPNEAAYLLAVQADSKLITDGYKCRVLIAGPTTILHIARIVESLWRNEERSKSLHQIGERAKLLFEGFTRFVDALENVRASILKAAAEIHNAEESNNEAMKRLTSGRGNLVNQAEKLGHLANKSPKQIAARVLEMAEEEAPLSLSLAADSGTNDAADADESVDSAS